MVILSGVLCIFDDAFLVLDNVCRHLKPGGRIFIFDIFNSYDYDVIMRFKNNYRDKPIWESGYNYFSKASYEKKLAPMCDTIKWHPFQMKTDIPVNSEMPSSYTLNTQENGRIIVSTTGSMLTFSMLEVQIK